MSRLAQLRDRLARELDRRPTVRAVAPGLLLIVGGVLAFAGLLDAVWENDDVSLFDQPVLAALVASRGAVATAIFGVITAVSGPIVLPAIVAVACLTWARVRHEWWRPLLLMGAMVTSTAISVAIKGLVARPRPPLDTMVVPGEMSASFPSGHTIGAATLLLVTWYLVVRRYRSTARQVGWAVGTVVGTLAVGLSRMYLGYHFLTDVLAAIALAVAILGAVTIVDRLHTLREGKQR